MSTAIRSQREVIRGMLADLKMPGALEAVDGILGDIDGGRLAGTEAISRLLSAQITLRNNRRLQTAMRSSRLPTIKTLQSFDFSFQPSIKREQIESLCSGLPYPRIEAEAAHQVLRRGKRPISPIAPSKLNLKVFSHGVELSLSRWWTPSRSRPAARAALRAALAPSTEQIGSRETCD